MKFENLPNELLFYLFNFFDVIHLFRAFGGLNYRFESLLFNSDQKYHLNFQRISKHDLEVIHQDYFLENIVDHIISLHLSDDDETPVLSEYFLSHCFTLDQFKYLQSISLYHIHSRHRIDTIISQCQYLTHLSLIKCHFWHNEQDFQYIINKIWSLPILISCKFDYTLSGKTFLTQISIYSSSIKYISIQNIHCDFNTLSHLLEYTPNLQRLSTVIFCGGIDEQLKTSIPSIRSLNIVQKNSLNTMINLFDNMFNLCYLTLDTNYIYLNGHEWENILIKYLPNIKIFRLRMNFELSSGNREDQIDVLLDSFRTPFWLEKHQWFVQCDWSLSESHQHAILYTLPYMFNDFLYDNLCQSKSTSLNNRLYDRVDDLQYLEYENNSIRNLSRSLIQFVNIRHLHMTLPFHDHFFSVLPVLNQLSSLNIMLNNYFAYYQLQALLNRAPYLYSLTFRCLQNIQTPLFHLTNPSIRRLDFISMSTVSRGHFNTSECEMLAKSSLGQQCNVLLIKVQNRTNILYLIKTMLNLRSLIIQCEDEKQEKNSTNDELLQWLQNHLPFTYSINRDLNEPSKIRLWIG